MAECNRMNMIYVSGVCSEAVFSNILRRAKNKPGQQVQKYHRTLLKGLASHISHSLSEITAVSKRPNGYSGGIMEAGFHENWNDVRIHYLPTSRSAFIDRLFQMAGGFIYILSYAKKSDTVVVTDLINVSLNLGVCYAARIRNVSVVGIVTDIPELMTGCKDSRFVRLASKVAGKCDGYVFLTEKMNEYYHSDKGKPYIVVEGQVDAGEAGKAYHAKKIEDDRRACDPKIILYAGTLDEFQGIDYMMEGFLEAGLRNVELHIYGQGFMSTYVQNIADRHHNVVYHGVVENREVVDAQKKATLLINPRRTDEKYVAYSFPSKTMEYMVSGTPVLMTRLPGLPDDYRDYLFFIEKEDAHGMSEKLQEVLSLGEEILRKKGEDARAFVLKNKSSHSQAARIIDFCEALCSQRKKDGNRG